MNEMHRIDRRDVRQKGTLHDFSDDIGIPFNRLRDWARKKLITPIGYISNKKGRPSPVFHRCDLQVALYDIALKHGALGYKRCKCGRVCKSRGRRSVMCPRCTRKRDVAYREKHPDRVRNYRKAWMDKNPDKVLLSARKARSRRRAQTKGAKTSGQGIIQSDWSPKGKRCYWCGVPIKGKWHFDHVMPLSKGGAHENYNIVVACPKCNMEKRAQHPNEYTKDQMEMTY